MDTAASGGDFLVSRALGALLEFVDPIAAKYRMSMGVNKTRQNALAGSVNDLATPGQRRFDLPGSAYLCNPTILYQDCTVGDNAEVAHLLADPCPSRAGEGQQLRGVKNSNRRHEEPYPSLLSTTPRMRPNS